MPFISSSKKTPNFWPNIRPSFHPYKWFFFWSRFFSPSVCPVITRPLLNVSINTTQQQPAVDGDKHYSGYRLQDAVCAVIVVFFANKDSRKSFISNVKWRKRPGNETWSLCVDRTQGWVAVKHHIQWSNSGEIESKQPLVLQMEGLCSCVCVCVLCLS